MRLGDLIKDKTPIRLRHPIIGDVNWAYHNEHKCYCLFWDHGPEANKCLLVTETVLLDNLWETQEPSKMAAPLENDEKITIKWLKRNGYCIDRIRYEGGFSRAWYEFDMGVQVGVDINDADEIVSMDLTGKTGRARLLGNTSVDRIYLLIKGLA